jgi:hypothetical protein
MVRVGRPRLMLGVLRGTAGASFVRALVEAGASFSKAASRDELKGRLFDTLRDLTGATGAVLVVKLPGEETILVEEAFGLMAAFAGQRLPYEGSVSSRVLTSGEPYVTNDAAELPTLSMGTMPSEVRGLAFVPLLADSRMPGVLGVVKNTPIQGDEVDRLRVISDIAGAWLQRLALHEDLVQSAVTAEGDYEDMINAWATALDRRERIADGHSQRATELTVRLARALGFSKQELPHLRRGALLHDIGKMMVPEEVLTKPGALDEGERALVRKHPEYAYDLLGSIEFLRRALPVPAFHHEHWDGSGYPRGLEREGIPLSARIFAVADVYETMTSSRAYSPAQGSNEVLHHIVEESGSHFDPRVVEALLTLVGPP